MNARAQMLYQFGRTRALASKAQIAYFYELKSTNIGRAVSQTDGTLGWRKVVIFMLLRLTGLRRSSW
jgi:hypothetical protein